MSEAEQSIVKKRNAKKERGRRASHWVAPLFGLIVLGGVLAGIVYFFTQRAAEDVKVTRNALEKDFQKLDTRFSDLTTELSEKLEELLSAKKNDENMIAVELYYYNLIKDEEIDPSLPCSADAVLPLKRVIPNTGTPIEDTIKLLIQGEISDEERKSGFTTEFPHPDFVFVGSNLKDGLLTLEFTNPTDFTTGGSCRTGLLRAQIEKTALQFEKVKEVKFKPEDLFQP